MDIQSITKDGEIIGGYTTADPRSSYGQPVFRMEQLPGVGDGIMIHYPDGEEVDAVVIGLEVGEDDEGWIMLDHVGEGTTCINTIFGRETGLVTDEGDPAYPPEDATGTHAEWIAEMLDDDRLRAADAIHIGAGLGGYLL